MVSRLFLFNFILLYVPRFFFPAPFHQTKSCTDHYLEIPQKSLKTLLRQHFEFKPNNA